MEPEVSSRPISAMGRAIARLKSKKQLKIKSDRKIRVQGIWWQCEQSALLSHEYIGPKINGPMCS